MFRIPMLCRMKILGFSVKKSQTESRFFLCYYYQHSWYENFLWGNISSLLLSLWKFLYLVRQSIYRINVFILTMIVHYHFNDSRKNTLSLISIYLWYTYKKKFLKLLKVIIFYISLVCFVIIDVGHVAWNGHDETESREFNNKLTLNYNAFTQSQQ